MADAVRRGGELGPASEAATNCEEASAACGWAARGLEAKALAVVVVGAATGALVCTSRLGVSKGEVRRLGEAGTAAAPREGEGRAPPPSSSCPSCAAVDVVASVLMECE